MRQNSRIDWNRQIESPTSPPVALSRWNREALASEVVRSLLREKRSERDALPEVARKPLKASGYRTILVPVDGTHFGEHALPFALGIARRTRAEVRVVLVHRPYRSSFPIDLLHEPGLPIRQRRERTRYLDDLLRRVKKVTSVRVTPVFLEGEDVAAVLSEYANDELTDLVVMATHGRGPLSRLWSESTAAPLMRRLSTPILFVRGYDAPVDLTGDPQIRNLVIPLDGSNGAESALEPALVLGSESGASHTLLRIDQMGLDSPIGDLCARFGQSGFHARRTEAWKYLGELENRMKEDAASIQSEVIQDERPVARAILDYCRKHDADMIAMSPRNRRGLARVFTNSVTDRVVRDATVPVLVCRAPVKPNAVGKNGSKRPRPG